MKKHILLIDDDEDELDFFVAMQQKVPGLFNCSYLSNPIDAVKTISSLRPDVVFLDMNMPGMNGLECMTEINRAGVTEGLNVVFYSTGMDDLACKKAKALGAKGCIKKPVDLDSFQKILTDLLSKL